MNGTIYIIKNIINNKRYVGQTIQSVDRRCQQHLSDSLNKNSTSYSIPFHNAIRKYGKENFILEYVYSFEFENIEYLNELEQYYIYYYNSYIRHNCGYNMTLGGRRTSVGRKINIYDINFNLIKSYDCLSLASSGLNIPATTMNSYLTKQNNEKRMVLLYKQYFIQYNEYPIYPYIPAKQKEKLIDVYDLNGGFIKTINSFLEAAEEFNVTSNSISACCRGKTLQCQNHVFRYHGDPFDKYKRKNQRRCPIELYDLNNQYINTFQSILKLSKYLNITPTMIQTKLKSNELLLEKYYVKRKKQ